MEVNFTPPVNADDFPLTGDTGLNAIVIAQSAAAAKDVADAQLSSAETSGKFAG